MLLPLELVIARKHGNTLRPRFAALTEANRHVADQLIAIFLQHQGAQKAALDAAIEAQEGVDANYRFIRGLATLVARRCRFEITAAIPPAQTRDAVFQAAARQGIPVTAEARQRILRAVAAKLDVTGEAVETSLYADLDSETYLTAIEPLDAQTLLQAYNVSLAQTLLFRSSMMEFTASSQWQRLFRQIKRLGLIYTIERTNGTYRVHVEGPLSLFRLTTRYGTCLARLLPTIVATETWEIHAQVQRRAQDRTLLSVHLDSQHHGAYFPPVHNASTNAFDSRVEQDFAQHFMSLHTGWTLQREPHPLPVGRHVMIPDFRFDKSEMTVYLEIVGFWTPGYLQHKLKQLEALHDVDMIIAADRALACQELEQLRTRHTLIYYRKQVPLQPILQHLKTREAALQQQQLNKYQNVNLPLSSAVVTISDLATQLGVLPSVVEAIVAARGVPNYHRVGDAFIQDALWQRIAKVLQQRIQEGPLSLHDAAHLIEELGGRHPTRILDTLGYRIEWRGIDPSTARVHPTSR
jgi:predicted nuclease of restriction endonuclease-like RecB superfamily